MQRAIGINNVKSRMKLKREDNMTLFSAPYLFRSLNIPCQQVGAKQQTMEIAR